MQLKKVLAVVMSLCMVAGAVSYGAPVISQVITAQAEEAEEECYSFDEKTGVLTLRGNVDVDTVKSIRFKDDVTSIVAEEGTVFPEDCYWLFANFANCISIDLSNVDTSKVEIMTAMFYNCVALTSLDVSGFNTRNVTMMSGMFNGCEALTSLDVSSFETSNVTGMGSMFSGCSGLTSLDLTHFNTEKVRNMQNMFSGCSGLTSLDLTHFNTEKVWDMQSMFSGCSALTSIDVSNFTTTYAIQMSQMFEGCSGLTTLDLQNFETEYVEQMFEMFSGCTNLVSLDLSTFNTKSVKQMYGLFKDCSSLTMLDLSGFDLRKANKNTDYTDAMFSGCSSLDTITLGEKFGNLSKSMKLPNADGWVSITDRSNVVSGKGNYAYINNEDKNTYVRNNDIKPTYPTNINVQYSKEFHQVRFTWDKVEGADRYGIAVYLTGKWRIQTQDITDTVYTTPKNLVPNKTYKVAIAARVNGKWDTKNAIRNAVTITVK
ncbi:cell surface protein [Ruminococcus albus SY3]|uniref:Cell surface protein n=1 Tax=Ruminococcus albus SY3 TaxID=1341156 RepID=A0A011VYD8_RUMAL|nr:BspA family leucine-rich repeat surface protein [Ruminococcus albus]EXM40336.1 cell surface protein [Ruminococcus albus SY3]